MAVFPGSGPIWSTRSRKRSDPRGVLAGLCLAFVAGPALSQTAHIDGFPPKLRVEGDTLIYDTINASEDGEDITSDDIDLLRSLLNAHPEISLLELNSAGGSVWASQEISSIVISAGLDTTVNGDCDSSCVTIFLAGTNRSLTRGSRLGFHQNYWRADRIEQYYQSEREEAGWETPWDFAEWMYEDTQQEVYLHLTYMVNRGVDPAFAIQSVRRPDVSMWRPNPAVLRAANVLTE